MLTSTVLLLTAMSPPAAADIAPLELAARPHVIERSDASYDWALQQGRRAPGLKLAYTETAACDTGPTCHVINGQQVCYHDCRFD